MNIYQTTTDRILAQMETGIMPWRQTWQAGLPSSLASRREYRGINILVLAAAGYSSRYWLTFREALRLGGHVRKGEKATTVVYWKWRTPEDLRQAAKETGRTDLPRCVPFTGNVFNLEQVEGVERPTDEVRQEPPSFR